MDTIALMIKLLVFFALEFTVLALILATLTLGMYIPVVKLYQRVKKMVHEVRRQATVVPETVRRAAAACMQCGTCTGSCVAARWMDYGPRGIFALLAAHQDEDVLFSQTIWTCASCYACTVRCPRDIPITNLMSELRREAMQNGYWPRQDGDYNRSFLDVVRRHGHIFETELMVRLGLADPLGILVQVPKGLRMLSKGKLSFVPHRIQGRQELDRLFAHYDAR